MKIVAKLKEKMRGAGFLCWTCKDREINKDLNQKIMFFFMGSEAFYESFSQMILQGHTILNGYDITKIQIVAFVASFVMLAKTSISFEI